MNINNFFKNKNFGSALFIIDENTPDYILNEYFSLINIFKTAEFITNCYDISCSLRSKKLSVSISDFDFNSKKYDVVFFYVSQIRLLSNYVINSMVDLLNENGILCLAGLKNEGIKAYMKTAKNIFGEFLYKTKLLDKSIFSVFRKTKNSNISSEFDLTYKQEISINNSLNYISKPGVFGYDKIDYGSLLLIQNIPDLKNKTVLDLGCGYGFLTIQASVNKNAKYVLSVDNSYTAVKMCEKNIKNHKINASVLLSDVASEIKERFDIILCNPPFHKGKRANKGLTDKFLNAIPKVLKKTGEAYFVFSSSLAIEARFPKKIKFKKVVEKDGYKVYKFYF